MNLNTHTSRLEAQTELEAYCVNLGKTAYEKALIEDGQGSGAAGHQLMKAALRPMEEALVGWLQETGSALASRGAGVYHFINQFEPVVAAFITASSAFYFLGKPIPVARVATSLALELEAHLNLEEIAQANKNLGQKMAKRMATVKEGKNRLVLLRKGAELVDAKVIQWDNMTRVRVGTLLLEMFAQSTGLIAIETAAISLGRTQTSMRPTESCMKWLEVSHARCALLQPARMPMLCRPRYWSGPYGGGYLSKQLRQPLVKTRNKAYMAQLKEIQMGDVYSAVNTLQETAWSVNLEVKEVLDTLWEAGAPVAGLPSREPEPLPARCWSEGETPEPEMHRAWKVDAAKTWERNGKLMSKRVQLVQKRTVAEKMLELGNRFHFVYNLDWRGRMYPVGGALTPQGDDSAKALLQFADAQPLGDDGAYWLAIHGANSYGVDKVSFEDRLAWVAEHTDHILDAAKNPLDGAMWWAQADSPFVFLAFCFEWAKLHTHIELGAPQETFLSHLPVAFDGSCNGLQNFSAMLKDPVGGKATGLIPSEKPADIYSEVAKAAQARIDRDAKDGLEVAQRWVGKMTRKLAKRNTMTVPYGVTKRGMRDQLFGELTNSEGKQRAEDAEYLSMCNYEAIGEVVVAARLAMDWLRDAAKVAASGGLPVHWTTPAGMLVLQDYRTDEGDMADFVVLGRRYQLLIQKDGDRLSTRKQSLGISPNFVHSLDASHLMSTVNGCAAVGIRDFAMIHDSYGCHAGHASLLRDQLRAAFITQYSAPVLEEFRDELLAQLPPEQHADIPPLPPMGDLDLSLVAQSEYFFA